MLSARSLRTWSWLHKWTSLICTVFMLLLCLTGLPLIFHHEIGHLLGTEVEPVNLPTNTLRVSLDKVMEVAKARYPGKGGMFVSQAEDDDRLINVNVRGVFTASKAAVNVMGSGGRIVNIGSINAERAGVPSATGYAMTKSAILGLTRGMARDLGKQGITVNVIQPGPIGTDINPPDGPWAEETIKMLAVPRYGLTEEIAAGVAYLVSPEAAFVTGTTLTIDGGFLS
ncbi:SDR family oxidoreductase [Chitinimonas sp. PSY-7]|uniref:SDR family oxidoreductase n=1 Tax=Chitinimonas sp. PSY-7 TaxID=3459088 RepID=UPI00403FCA73